MEEMPLNSKPLILSYKAMAYMIEANHVFNPYKKLYFFKNRKQLLDKAVRASPENVEIKFLCFCIQTNAPFSWL